MKLNSLRPLLCKGSAALVSSAAALVLSGCAMGTMQLSGPDQTPTTTTVKLSGTVHGGQQPISGAVIQLYVVGASGYGSTATGLVSPTNQAIAGKALTDSNGTFNISGEYTCPAAPTNATTGPYVYITATGGNPGVGSANINSVLAAPLGLCTGISGTTIVINEVTTAAMAYALGQYFTTTFGATSTDSFGAPNTTQGQVGLANAFGTAANLVTTSTGNAVQSVNLPASCTSASTYCITATPEYTKLYTVANILAACVNSGGIADTSDTSCSTLFADVVPTSGTAPTDTLQAAVDMSLNPTSSGGSGYAANMQAIYNLQSATSPYPGETAPYTGGSTQPTDWTIGINYTDIATGTPTLTQPADVAVDASGNIWVVNDVSGGTANGALGELSPTGTPLFGSNFPSETGATTLAAAGPRHAAIDLSGNVWIPSTASSGYTYEYAPGTAGTAEIPYAHLSKAPWGIAIDQNGNTYIGMESSSATIGMYEYPAGVSSTSSIINQEGEFAVAVFGGAGVVRPEYMAFDNSTAHNLWISSGSATSSIGQLSDITLCTPSGGPPAVCTESTTSGANTYTSETTSVGTVSTPSGLASGPNGMWFANRANSTITYLPIAANGTYTASSQSTYGSSSTTGTPAFLAVDGSGNVWTTDNGQTSPASISELSSAGTALSPSSAGTMPFNVMGYSHVGLNTGAGIAIDPSGNVWVANNVASGTDFSSVFELVGAASPTITPIAAALAGAKVGTKP